MAELMLALILILIMPDATEEWQQGIRPWQRMGGERG